MSTATLASGILPGEALDEATTKSVLDEFYRDGIALVPQVLTPDEVDLIRRATDRWIDDPPPLPDGVFPGNKPVIDRWDVLVLRYTQSLERLFCDMLVREPFLSLAEAVLGPDCGFVGQNVIRSPSGGAISRWHVDDTVEFPLPDNVPRHDPRTRMPITWFSFQIALSDIDSVEHGPTEIVRTSHYSGRNVPPPEKFEFEGHKPESILCKAGDMYLFNHQLWHRGSPNTGTRVRYLMQNQYSRRWCNTRFGLPQNQCHLPEVALAGAGKRLRRLVNR